MSIDPLHQDDREPNPIAEELRIAILAAQGIDPRTAGGWRKKPLDPVMREALMELSAYSDANLQTYARLENHLAQRDKKIQETVTSIKAVVDDTLESVGKVLGFVSELKIAVEKAEGAALVARDTAWALGARLHAHLRDVTLDDRDWAAVLHDVAEIKRKQRESSSELERISITVEDTQNPHKVTPEMAANRLKLDIMERENVELRRQLDKRDAALEKREDRQIEHAHGWWMFGAGRALAIVAFLLAVAVGVIGWGLVRFVIH